MAQVTDQDCNDERRHRDAKALRQLRDKLDRQRRQEVREALEKWAASPPPPADDPPPMYRP